MTSVKTDFLTHGYVVSKGLFSVEEVRNFQQEIKRVLEVNRQRGSSQDVDRDGVFVGLAKNSTVFKQEASHKKLVAILREVIGENIVFLSDKVVIKNGKIAFSSPWHQDWPYWKGSHKYSVWIALDDTTVNNGCLKVIPGSHLSGEVKHDGDASDKLGFVNRLSPAEIDESKAVNVEIQAGDAIIFHDLLMHASNPNLSGKDRTALISTYKDGTISDPNYEWAGAAFRVFF